MALTQMRLRKILDYDPTTGIFRRKMKTSNSVRVGEIAGGLNAYGYRVISVGGNIYQASRLAWLWVHGQWPMGQIDHINHITTDNRIANLRDVTIAQNRANSIKHRDNGTGFKGVSKKRDKFEARIYHGRKINLGVFDTPEEAHQAYCEAAIRLKGEFAHF